MKGAKEKCLASGMNDYISKPIDIDHLNTLCCTYLPQHKKHEIEEDTHTQIEHQKTQSHSSDVFCWDHIRDFSEGDAEAETTLMNIFINNLASDIKDLSTALDNGDYTRWLDVVHKIYGSSAHMGAVKLSYNCDYAQTISSGNEQEIIDLHAIILQDYANLMAYFKNFSTHS